MRPTLYGLYCWTGNPFHAQVCDLLANTGMGGNPGLQHHPLLTLRAKQSSDRPPSLLGGCHLAVFPMRKESSRLLALKKICLGEEDRSNLSSLQKWKESELIPNKAVSSFTPDEL